MFASTLRAGKPLLSGWKLGSNLARLTGSTRIRRQYRTVCLPPLVPTRPVLALQPAHGMWPAVRGFGSAPRARRVEDLIGQPVAERGSVSAPDKQSARIPNLGHWRFEERFDDLCDKFGYKFSVSTTVLGATIGVALVVLGSCHDKCKVLIFVCTLFGVLSGPVIITAIRFARLWAPIAAAAAVLECFSERPCI